MDCIVMQQEYLTCVYNQVGTIIKRKLYNHKSKLCRKWLYTYNYEDVVNNAYTKNML